MMFHLFRRVKTTLLFGLTIWSLGIIYVHKKAHYNMGINDEPGSSNSMDNNNIILNEIQNNSVTKMQASHQKLHPSDKQTQCNPDDLAKPPYLLSVNVTDSTITCSQLIGGQDKTLYNTARAMMKKHPKTKVPDEKISLRTADCEKFKLDRSYHLHYGSEEERDFPIAFNLLVHQDAYQVENLLKAIYRPQNQYCIHADAKSNGKFLQAVKDLVKCFDNVFMASKLEHVTYGGFSRIQADITCMKDHLSRNTRWKYLFNLAGQAFPLKTNREMVQILQIYNGSNDIEGITGNRRNIDRWEMQWKEVYDEKHRGQLKKTIEKNPPAPYDIDIVKGSAYGVFSRAFVDFILNDKKAQALLEWCKNTYSPDEHYWATLHHTHTNPHLHTPGGYSGKPDDKPWLAAWVAWLGEAECHGTWRRGHCLFGVEDLPSLVSRHEFFANKLFYDHQPLTLECLSSWLEHRVQCHQDIDRDFYNRLPFVTH